MSKMIWLREVAQEVGLPGQMDEASQVKGVGFLSGEAKLLGSWELFSDISRCGIQALVWKISGSYR